MKEYNKINPEWLIGIKKNGKLPDEIPFHNVLENSLLYPAAGDDCRYIYSFTKFDQILKRIFHNILERKYYEDRGGFYDFINHGSYRLEINTDFEIYSNTLFRVDTFVYNDYLFHKESKYNHDINAILSTLSSKFKLLAERYIDSYKIDINTSYKTAIYLIQNKKSIKDICKLYVEDSKIFDEKLLNFKTEDIIDEIPTPSFLLGRQEPTFVHWSVWEDETTRKIFSLLYFSEEAHVNLLRTYVKHKKTPKIIIFHRDGVNTFGCGWIDFFSNKSPYIPMLMLIGLPDIFIYQYMNNIHKDVRYILLSLYKSIYRLDFSKIVPDNFVNVLNEPHPNNYNTDDVLVSNLLLEKLKVKIITEKLYKL